MNVDQVRELCLSFPYATEQITWGCDLTFRVSAKIFAVTVLEPAPVWLSFKCSPEDFADLTERNGIIPAPYLARAQWVALETRDALPPDELARLLRQSYDLVVAKLPKKTFAALSQSSASKKTARRRPHAAATPARKHKSRKRIKKEKKKRSA
jgi:predicted DNA-binding protein (MmcQ/YjbR family)